MAHACLAAMQSQDPKSQVGAVIVNEHQEIVGTGYNSMPHGCPDDKFSLGKGKQPYGKINLFFILYTLLKKIT